MSQGYISSVSFRLFTRWEGNEPLYLFTVSNNFLSEEILRRYPIMPERDTTTWQTINTLSYKIPIFIGNYLGFGMQDSGNTNKIYAIKNKGLAGVLAGNIHNYTTHISLNFTEYFGGVAFSYIVFQNGKKIFDKDLFVMYCCFYLAETNAMTPPFVG
jgi:hypothetical protein